MNLGVRAEQAADDVERELVVGVQLVEVVGVAEHDARQCVGRLDSCLLRYSTTDN